MLALASQEDANTKSFQRDLLLWSKTRPIYVGKDQKTAGSEFHSTSVTLRE